VKPIEFEKKMWAGVILYLGDPYTVCADGSYVVDYASSGIAELDRAIDDGLLWNFRQAIKDGFRRRAREF